jgi:hypothetical protein
VSHRSVHPKRLNEHEHNVCKVAIHNEEYLKEKEGRRKRKGKERGRRKRRDVWGKLKENARTQRQKKNNKQEEKLATEKRNRNGEQNRQNRNRNRTKPVSLISTPASSLHSLIAASFRSSEASTPPKDR